MADILTTQLRNTVYGLDRNFGSSRQFKYTQGAGLGNLHNTYSENGVPGPLGLQDFNGSFVVPYLPKPSILDENDPLAPNNPHPLDYNYKSTPGKQYKDLGPVGHY